MVAAWDSVPEAERPFQRRLMEMVAGFADHMDAQVGTLVDALEHVRDPRLWLDRAPFKFEGKIENVAVELE